MKAAGFLCIAYGENPSRRNIQKRIAETNGGKTFSTIEIATFLKKTPWLVPDRYHPGTTVVPPLTLKNGELVPSSVQPSTLRARVVKVLELEASSTPIGVAEQPTMFESWQELLEREALGLSPRRIADLSIEELYRVGQIHALRYTRYRVSETKNREQGMTFATQIKNVVTSKAAFRDMTVREYIAYGKKIYDALPDKKSGKEWRKPWDILVYAL